MAALNRPILFCGGLAGALGVAAAAAAAHAGGPNLGTVATILLAHAPALLALSQIHRRFAVVGGYVIIVGILLFCGDLVARDIVGGDAYVRSGQWKNGRRSRTTRVAGKRAGIVGLGRIGRGVADRLAGVGLKVTYHGPRAKPGVPYDYVGDIVGLAATVDFLVMTCPGDETTKHIVNRDVLRALGPDGFLINVSRGTVVDEEALLEALENGAIAGAGLDVFAQEPVPNPRFLKLSNVVLQPHTSVLTDDNLRALTDEVCRILGAAPNKS